MLLGCVVRGKQPLAFLRRHSLARISDAQFHCFTLWLSAESKRAALRHGVHRIENQVAQGAMEQFGVGIERHGLC